MANTRQSPEEMIELIDLHNPTIGINPGPMSVKKLPYVTQNGKKTHLTALHIAVRQGDVRTINDLLAQKPYIDINQPSEPKPFDLRWS